MRYQRFHNELRKSRLNGYLITQLTHLDYLFNFRGSAGMALALEDEALLIVDSRYFEQARSQARDCSPVLAEGPLLETLRDLVAKATARRGRLSIGFQGDSATYSFVRKLRSWNLTCRWFSSSDWVAKQRLVKEGPEIQLLKESFRRAQDALEAALHQIGEGMRETEIAGCLERELRRQGSGDYPFPTIVASGPRSSLAHAGVSERPWSAGEPLLIDFGLRHQGYCSDLTRMRIPPGSQAVRIAGIVRDAQLKALETIRPGRTTGQVDAAARDWIDQRGFGDYFGHGLGHGLGLDVHEAPQVRRGGRTVLKEGMVFTVEPGIYIPGSFGIRIEDAVVVTRQGFDYVSDPAR